MKLFVFLLTFSCLLVSCGAPTTAKLPSKIFPLTTPVPVVNSSIALFSQKSLANPPHEEDSSHRETAFYLTNLIDKTPKFSDKGVFDCVGTIHAVVKFGSSNLSFRNQALVITWINPDGEEELSTSRLKYAEQGSEAFRWAGITLSRPQAGNLFSLIDPLAGMERFIGEWKVRVKVNRKSIGEKAFVVQC